MLYHLLYPLHETYSIFNVFRYITFRTIYAIITALLIALVLGPWFINKLRSFNLGQHIREDGPSGHLNKRGTPTMGGVVIIGATLLGWLVLGETLTAQQTLGMLVILGAVALVTMPTRIA
jgi:phospho-N-acetylmuramoyl-pentapeptide-transferase